MMFHLPGNSSLKGKRAIVRKMLERSRAKFNAAIAEVGRNDNHRSAVIGLAVVGNDASHVDSMLSTISSFMEQLGVAVAAERSNEVIPMGDAFGQDDFSRFLGRGRLSHGG